jgi:hypothetical protein
MKFFNNIDKLHTTKLGNERIRRNLNLETDDIVSHCKKLILKAKKIINKGKNWYIYANENVITVNMYSHTIITAHKIKSNFEEMDDNV